MSSKSASISSYLGRLTLITAQVVIIVFFIRFFVLELGRVEGLSMDPQLPDDTLFIVNRISLYFKQPEKGDIIQLYHPTRENALVVKRVVGLPGDTISISNNRIMISKEGQHVQPLEEKYLNGTAVTQARGIAGQTIEIPPHHYFVMGDNRPHSIDSRDYGLIHRNRITGVVIPLN